jgi:hypothetical protein
MSMMHLISINCNAADHQVPQFGPSHQTHHEIDGKCGGREGGSCMMVNLKGKLLFWLML